MDAPPARRGVGKPYTGFEMGGRNKAGMKKMDPKRGPVTPNREVYFAGLTDPQGVHFSILQMAS